MSGRSLLQRETLQQPAGGKTAVSPTAISSPSTTATAADTFTTGTTLTSRSTPTGAKAWTVNAGTWSINGGVLSDSGAAGDIAWFPGGSARCTIDAVVVPSHTSTSAYAAPGLVFRYTDASNYFYVSVNSATGYIDLYRVTTGTATLLAEVAVAMTSQYPVPLSVGLNGPDITLYLAGTDTLTVSDTQGLNATGVGVRNGTAGAPPAAGQWWNVTVRPFQGPVLNWPRASEATDKMLVGLGTTGAWDDTDVNNPNIVWDPNNQRWVLYYSGFHTGNGNFQQGMGLAYSTGAIDGPYTKDGANPVFTDASAGDYNMNGGLVYFQGQWIHIYGSGAGSTLSLSRSPDLHTWTNQGVVNSGGSGWGGVFDAFLRIRQDGITLECWFAGARAGGTGRYIGYMTSIDGGYTWTLNPTPVLSTPAFAAGNTFSEPSVYVPPGKEGREMVIHCDLAAPSTSSTRRICQVITVDGGLSWHWRVAAYPTGAAGTWVAGSLFDPFMACANDRYYLFHSGAPGSGASLNMGIQVGVRSGPFTNSTLAIESGSYTPPAIVVPASVTVPPQVTGLTLGTVGPSSAQLTWTAAATSTSYQIQQSTDGGTTWVNGPTASGTTLYVTGLANSTAYKFRVAGVNAAGTGTYSTAVSATTTSPVTAADTFDRANSTTTLGTASDGGTWTVQNGTWGISSNQAYDVSGSGAQVVRDLGSANHYVEAKVPVTNSVVIVCRCTDVNNWYGANFISGGALQIWKRVAGSSSKITGGDAGTWTAGDTIRIQAVGNQISVYRNGTLAGSVTDSSLTTGTTVGMRADLTSARFDNFNASTV